MTRSLKPCPCYVVVKGERIYCEQGEKGHPGTCYGSRTEAEYKRLLAWRKQEK